MKKISLLAASVALALVGCGGSDGDSSTNTGTPSAGGIIITGFDGYFKNAVVFDDVNNNGVLDVNVDTVFGLTDKLGQIELPKDTETLGSIALQTLKPGAVVTLGLGDHIAAATDKVDFASDYSDTYTTDMDLPGQPMEHSVVFRSQQDGENIVISPITDLVALQPATVYSTEKSAEQKVCDSLFGEDKVTDKACTDKLYSDFTTSDPVLHKTAQILTETKATSEPSDYTTKIDSIAKVAMETAVTLNTEENKDKLTDPTYKPVIDTSVTVDNITPPTTTTYKTLVNEAKYNEIQNSLDKLNLEQATSPKETERLSISVADLFSDKDLKDTKIDVIANTNNVPKGMTFEIIDYKLVISGTPTEAGSFSLVLQPVEQTNVSSTVTARFSFDVQAEAGAVAPTVDVNEVTSLQESISDLKFVVGQSFVMPAGIVLDATALFKGDIKTIELSSNANGLTIKLDDTQNNILISGRPANAGEYYIQLKATADNGLSSEVVKLDLPTIVEAIEINDHEVKLLQDKINTLELTVGEKIDLNGLDLDITPIFNANVVGNVEFYAGLEFDKKQKNNHEYYTTIPGVRVHTDEVSGLGTLTILGTPKEATKGGYFYVAAGINPDTPDAIISEYVKITLPNVKPADAEIPPTQPGNNVSMENMFLYESAVESLDEKNNYDFYSTGVSCEVRYFKSTGAGTGEMFSFTRTEASFEKCPTIDKDTQPTIENGFESFGEYTVDKNHVISLQIEDEYYDDSGNSFMGKGDINISAKMFDKKFITTLQEKITPPEGHGDGRTWKSLYAASTTPNSANAIMAEWHKLEDDSVNQLENTIYFTDESGNIQPLRVDATMNSVDQDCTGMCEEGKADADIYIKNMSCELVEKVYSFNVYSISESQFYWNQITPDNFFPYNNDDNSCVVDFTSYSDISLGIHTLHGEVKEAFQGKYQDIMFSFKKD